MPALTRADLTLEPARVQLKDGREVIIRRLSAGERGEYLGLILEARKSNKDAKDAEKIRVATRLTGELVALTVIDETGARLFASGDEAAGAMQEPLLDELAELAGNLNGIGDDRPNV